MEIVLYDHDAADGRDYEIITSEEECYIEGNGGFSGRIEKPNVHYIESLLNIPHPENSLRKVTYRGRITILFYIPFMEKIISQLQVGGLFQVKATQLFTDDYNALGLLFYAPPVPKYNKNDYLLTTNFPLKMHIKPFFSRIFSDIFVVKYDFQHLSFKLLKKSVPSPQLEAFAPDCNSRMNPPPEAFPFLHFFDKKVAIIGGSENSGLCRMFPGCFYPIGLSAGKEGLNLDFKDWETLKGTELEGNFDIVLIERAETELTLFPEVWNLAHLISRENATIYATIYDVAMRVPYNVNQNDEYKNRGYRDCDNVVNSSTIQKALFPIRAYPHLLESQLGPCIPFYYGPGSCQKVTTFSYTRKN